MVKLDTNKTILPITGLCRGDDDLLGRWFSATDARSLGSCLLLITLGTGLYGLTAGLWRGWEMAAYVAVKLPAAVILTLILNALLNGMLGLVLGSGIGFRQSMQFLLTAFAVMSVILGALAPVTFFLALNASGPAAEGARLSHSLLLLAHTGLIAMAGVLSHGKLLHLLRRHAATPQAGTCTFFAWLAGNLFAGAQVSWVLRPFFGSPGLEVQFLRPNPLEGSFYEAVFHAAGNLCGF